MKNMHQILIVGAVLTMLACGNTNDGAKSSAIGANATQDQARTQTLNEAMIIQT